MIRVQILGTGCPKCKKMAEAVEKAISSMETPYEIEKVTDIQKILSYGVMMTPALVVNGKVKVTGRVPSPDEIKTMIM